MQMLAVERRKAPERAQLAPKLRRPSAQKRNSLANPATVLVVDDDPSVLQALARLMRADGFRVRTFDRPGALLASEMPTTNACMLVDVHLPEMNGFQLCKALAETGRGLPAIMITGRDDAETRRMIEREHPVAALFKPIEENALLEAVAHGLALSKCVRTQI